MDVALSDMPILTCVPSWSGEWICDRLADAHDDAFVAAVFVVCDPAEWAFDEFVRVEPASAIKINVGCADEVRVAALEAEGGVEPVEFNEGAEGGGLS
jgi:hypothetical protein